MYDRDAVSLFCDQTADASLLGDATRAPDPEEGLDMLFLTDVAIRALACSESTGPQVVAGPVNWQILLGRTER